MSPTFASLRYHNYRLWFAGALVANIGTWMQRVAQDWLVLTDLTDDSGVAVGITTALQFAPVLFLSAWAGLLADRVDRRKLLIGTQTAMGVLAAGLGALVLSGHVELWHVYGFAFLLGWNEFLFALILAGPESRTLPVMVAGFETDRGVLWGQFSAAAVSIMLPVIAVALVLQRHIVKGLTMGAVKG